MCLLSALSFMRGLPKIIVTSSIITAFNTFKQMYDSLLTLHDTRRCVCVCVDAHVCRKADVLFCSIKKALLTSNLVILQRFCSELEANYSIIIILVCD